MNVPLVCSISGHREKKALYPVSASTVTGSTPSFANVGLRSKVFQKPNPNGPGVITFTLQASPSFGACTLSNCQKFSPAQDVSNEIVLDGADCNPGQCPKPTGLKCYLNPPLPTDPGQDETKDVQGKWYIARKVSYRFISQKYDIDETYSYHQWSQGLPATVKLKGKIQTGASTSVTKIFDCDFNCRMCGGVLNCQNECPGDCGVFKYTHTNPNFEIYCDYCL